jgi:hypothetical protein
MLIIKNKMILITLMLHLNIIIYFCTNAKYSVGMNPGMMVRVE